MYRIREFLATEDERGLYQDYETWLERLVPHEPAGQVLHNRTGEDACPEPGDRNAHAA